MEQSFLDGASITRRMLDNKDDGSEEKLRDVPAWTSVRMDERPCSIVAAGIKGRAKGCGLEGIVNDRLYGAYM